MSSCASGLACGRISSRTGACSSCSWTTAEPSSSSRHPELPGMPALRATRIALTCLVAAVLGGCASLPERPQLPAMNSIAPAAGAPLDRAIAEAEAQHPGAAGFRLVIEGMEAFVIRAQSARLAARTLDVQTYIWHADATGLYLAQTLLEAADRGVRVRLLVDDLDARAKNAGFAALAAHPNIEEIGRASCREGGRE